MLFSAHKDLKIRVWNFSDPDDFRSKRVLTMPKRTSLSLFWSPRASSSSKSPTNHKECVSCMAYCHPLGLLYTGSHDKTVKVWRVSTSQCVDSFVAHDDRVNSIVVNQHDGCVFTCSSDGSIKLWRIVYGESHTLTMTLRSNPSPINALALSLHRSLDDDNNKNRDYCCFLYSGSSDGTINFWEKEKVSCRFGHGGFLQGHSYGVLCLVSVHKLIFSGSEDTTIRVWRRQEGSCFHECLVVLDGHRGPVRCLWACLEIDRAVVKGFLVYSASLDQTLKVWRVRVLPDTVDDHHVWLDI
ncbi:protein JINGUBANG-like [Punica granatum]|nr:protein JINGUBANG-like [Punica granatum]